MIYPFENEPLQVVTDTCQKERKQFEEERIVDSPACAELFWRALKYDDEGAWASLYVSFEVSILRWINGQRFAEPADIMQETWLSFRRSGSKNTDLVSSRQLNRYLAYFKDCLKTATIQQDRLVRRTRLEGKQHLFYTPSIASIPVTVEVRQILLDCLNAHLHNDQERNLFFDRFVNGYTAQEILKKYLDEFKTIQDIYKLTQKIVRRIEKCLKLQGLLKDENDSETSSTARQNDDSSHSLNMSLFTNEIEDTSSMDDCPLGEDMLLSYILGDAPHDIVSIIATTPACQRAVQHLAQTIQPLLNLFYRFECPEPAMIVRYHNQDLSSIEHLLIHKHIQNCSLCQEELTILSDIDQRSMHPVPRQGLRNIVKALFKPPLAYGLKGSTQTVLDYETPTHRISLRLMVQPNDSQYWTIHGQIRLTNHQYAPDIESIELQGITDPSFTQTLGDSSAQFKFVNVPYGRYRLLVHTTTDDLLLEPLIIGHE